MGIEIKMKCELCGVVEGIMLDKWSDLSHSVDSLIIREYDIFPSGHITFKNYTKKTLCMSCYDGYQRIHTVCDAQKEQLINDFFDKSEPEECFITEEDFNDI